MDNERITNVPLSDEMVRDIDLVELAPEILNDPDARDSLIAALRWLGHVSNEIQDGGNGIWLARSLLELTAWTKHLWEHSLERGIMTQADILEALGQISESRKESVL
jgi:hypothetical protein